MCQWRTVIRQQRSKSIFVVDVIWISRYIERERERQRDTYMILHNALTTHHLQGNWMKPARQKQGGTKLRKLSQPWLWVGQAGSKEHSFVYSVSLSIYICVQTWHLWMLCFLACALKPQLPGLDVMCQWRAVIRQHRNKSIFAIFAELLKP